MASKHSPSALCSGLVMGADFIRKFHDALVVAGGGDTFLHFLTTKQGSNALKAAAEVAVKHHLPVLRTVLEKLEAEYMIQMFDSAAGDIEPETMYSWDDIGLQETFGIEVIMFCNNSELDGDRSRMLELPEILRQIVGKPLPYPLVVQYNGESMVVVGLHSEGYGTPKKGQILKEEEFHGFIKLASAKYFDLEH